MFVLLGVVCSPELCCCFYFFSVCLCVIGWLGGPVVGYLYVDTE